MADFMPVRDALRYFGIAYLSEDEPISEAVMDQLEAIVVEHDLDIEATNRGDIISIEPLKAQEALFKEHEKKVGHRPDHPGKMHEAKAKHEAKEKQDKERQEQAKERVKLKVKEKTQGGNGG